MSWMLACNDTLFTSHRACSRWKYSFPNSIILLLATDVSANFHQYMVCIEWILQLMSHWQCQSGIWPITWEQICGEFHLFAQMMTLNTRRAHLYSLARRCISPCKAFGETAAFEEACRLLKCKGDFLKSSYAFGFSLVTARITSWRCRSHRWETCLCFTIHEALQSASMPI